MGFCKNDISLIDIPNDMKETRFPFKFLRNTINRQSKIKVIAFNGFVLIIKRNSGY